MFVVAKKCAAITKSRVEEEKMILKKALEKKEAEANDKKEARKQYEEKLRVEMEKYRQELALLQEKQKIEDEQFKAWEIQQRLQRDEFNKNIKAQDYERERLKKQKIAESLRRQIVRIFFRNFKKFQNSKQMLITSIIYIILY